MKRLVVLAFVLAIPNMSRGDLISVMFSGTVTKVSDYQDIFGGRISVGDPYHARVIYDTANPGSAVIGDMDEQRQFYQYYASAWDNPVGLSVSIDGFHWFTNLSENPTDAFHVEVIDRLTPRYSYDVLNFGSSNFDTNFLDPVRYNDKGMGFQLISTSYSAFSGTDLPTWLSPEAWVGNHLGIFANDHGTYGISITGSVDSFRVVPEPSTLALFGLGMLGLLGCRLRRER